MSDTIFTKIINGNIPSYKIAENDKFIAILDIQPLQLGHTLVIPKDQIDYIFNQSDEILSEILLFSKKIAIAIEKVIDCKRVGLTVIGLEVSHTHIHLIPINSESDMNFSNSRLDLSPEEFENIAKKISEKVKL